MTTPGTPTRTELHAPRRNVLYELLYLARFRPWERGGVARDLRDLVEGPGRLPPGRALDIGCGTGLASVYLAAHGWDVTGVDVVGRALAQGRERAAAAGVSLRLVHADVTRAPRELATGAPYRLLLDAGCYHGLDEEQRAGYARVMSDLAGEDAMLLLFALTPGGRARPRTFRGASEMEIRTRFVEWELVSRRPHAARSVLGVGQFWYLLRRRAIGRSPRASVARGAPRRSTER